MISFRRVISEAEVHSYYVNLTDEQGQTYGYAFPPDKSRLVIVDGLGRESWASQRGRNQIWGSLKTWFVANGVQSGTKIEIAHDPDERRPEYPSYPVLHLRVVTDDANAQDEESEPVAGVEKPQVVSGYEIPISLEKELQDFLERNLDLVEPGLRLYINEDGRSGREYPTDVGSIDLLCSRADGSFLVIELKRRSTSDVAVGQISRYMGWVRRHIGANSGVSGLIIAHDKDEMLEYAVAAHDRLSVRYYRLKIEFV